MSSNNDENISDNINNLEISNNIKNEEDINKDERNNDNIEEENIDIDIDEIIKKLYPFENKPLSQRLKDEQIKLVSESNL